MYIKMILQYKEHLAKLESEMDALAKDIEEYNIIKSILVLEKKSLQRLFPKLGR